MVASPLLVRCAYLQVFLICQQKNIYHTQHIIHNPSVERTTETSKDSYTGLKQEELGGGEVDMGLTMQFMTLLPKVVTVRTLNICTHAVENSLVLDQTMVLVITLMTNKKIMMHLYQ